MSTPPGYHGRYLRVDLSTGRSETRPLSEEILRRFIGGTGLGTRLLQIEFPEAPVDALDPLAPLIFCFSPLVGTPLTTSAKFGIVAKSPLTQRINDSLSSSYFALAGKKTGYDAIVLVGQAPTQTLLLIEPDQVRLEDASEMSGVSSQEAQSLVRRRHGKAFQVAAIGPAGEHAVRFATISHDGRHAGRGGLGAVMGAKRLKAIAVKGDRDVTIAHPDRLNLYAQELSRKSFGPATAKYRELGTVSNLLVFNRLGSLPTRNFQQGSFEAAEQLAPETLDEQLPRTRKSCAACTIGCEHIFHHAGNDDGVRMEYENLFALGPLCGISDIQTVLKASQLCDEAGMDTISAGATVAFAMECAERGLIDEPELRFGHPAAFLRTLQNIVRREGLGDLLADGSRIASRQIGQGAEQFAPHVKGLEIPGYDPRAMQTMALGFAVGTRGADHNRSGAYQVDLSDQVDRLAPDDLAVPLAIESENEAAVMDSLILCKFLRGVFDDRMEAMAEMLRMVTGWEVTSAELVSIAERIIRAKKQFNIQQGWTPEEDILPRRFFETPLGETPVSGAVLSRERLQQMIQLYNRSRGWTAEGWLPES